jgi:ABC-2 type transport system permease protein
MNRALVIARNDLRVFLKNKAAYFWLFGSPFLFAFFIGMANRGPGDPANPRPSLAIENLDAGFMGILFIEELGGQGLNVIQATNNPARRIRIPSDFTSNVLAGKPVKVEMVQRAGTGEEAAAMIELRVFRAMVALNGHLVEQGETPGPPTEARLRAVLRKANPVTLKSGFATRKPIPAGYRQSVPGILVMFTMMNLLIFGGVSVASERREGVLRRLLANPVAFRELVWGKIIGLMFLGAAQIGFLLGAAMLFMGLNLADNLPEIILVLALYAWVASALGVFIGSVIARDDKVVAVCVLVAMVMAALGGCWWPLEIVPENVRLAGHAFPTAWTMDALHQLISFGGGLEDIWEELIILAGYAAAASFGAIRFFRV